MSIIVHYFSNETQKNQVNVFIVKKNDYAMLYPARLWIVWQGEAMFFGTTEGVFIRVNNNSVRIFLSDLLLMIDAGRE